MARISVLQGDITRIGIDAVVNAAHPSLEGGGGVDGAIHRAAGHRLLGACLEIGFIDPGDVGAPTKYVLAHDAPWRPRRVRCEVGDAVVTEGFGVAKWIVHTVGPRYDASQPENMKALLASAYTNSLTLAMGVGARTVAFPGISVGVFGFPMREAAMVAVDTVKQFLATYEAMTHVVFVVFDPAWGVALEVALGDDTVSEAS